MNIQMIELNQLTPSATNVRKTGAALGIEALAASIHAHGLLQNLQVRQGAKGRFEVVAGGRRLAALKLLVKQKKLAKDSEIPCHVLDAEDAGEISLAENAVRLSMHPADEFAAFHALALTGKGHEEIAARFGTSPTIVRQRLKLASVSPRLIDLYRAEEMSLDQLMAFTVSDDHAAQEAAWDELPDWNRGASTIRSRLTEAHVEAGDPRVRLIGVNAYLAAGGGIVRDLFDEEHGGFLTDAALLDRLVAERLEHEAETVRGEGWKWVQIVPRLDYNALSKYGEVQSEPAPLTDAAQHEFDQLSAEYEALYELHGDEPDDEAAARMEAINERIDALQDGEEVYSPEDIALAGAIITLTRHGLVEIRRGLTRPEDRKYALAVIEGGKADETSSESEGRSPLSARLVEDLTAERTAAMRATMQENQTVALVAVAHALALPVFYPYERAAAESCLDLRPGSRNLMYTESVAESGAAVLLANRHNAWVQRLPEEATDLFTWLLAQESTTVTELIAFCAAMSVDAVRGKCDRPDSPRLVHADQLANALGLDMAAWWEPTPSRYLGRVPKPLILEAVAEAVSPQAAENLAGLKKADLVARASSKLAGTGWLPALLRSPPPAMPEDETMAEAAE